MNAAANDAEARRRRYREEETESLKKIGDVGQMKRLLKYLAPRRQQVLLAIGLSMAIALLTLLPLILIKYTIDGPIMNGDGVGLLLMCAGLLALTALTFFVERYNAVLIARIGQDTMRDIRLEIFRHLQQQPLRYFDRNPVGRLITRLTSDVNVLNELFSNGIVGLFQQILSLFLIVGMLLYFNWQLTLWVMLVLPLMLVASWYFRNNVFREYRLTRVRLSRMNAFTQENITGMRTVQSNTREKSQYDIYDELNDGHRQTHLNTVFQYALFFPAVEVISTLGVAIVLWRGGLEYIGPAALTAVTVGQLALFIQALDKFFQPIKDLSEKYNIIQSSIAASERLFGLLDTPPSISDPATPHAAAPFCSTIEFRDVWFAYNNEDWVLKGISFTVTRGQSIAVVGPTGSGKTTLMSLLCRFYDIQRGAILIDGVDIREMAQSDLRAKIAIVMQDVFLFNGTVAENIRLGNPAITDERVRMVAEETGFADFVKDFPKGYNAGVKERGATLSTGQKQLLSFTRALAFDPAILVLDEATANIDTASEERLQRAVEKLCAGRTSIIIAHRLSTIQRANKILVLHHGKLIEEGSHAELLERDGLYRRLYELQYKEEPVGA